MKPYVITLARWLGRKALKAEWKAMGRKPEHIEHSDIAAYFMVHRNELMKEAWAHPVSVQYRQQERMKLARKAVIAAIREKGQRVNSIEPGELRKLIETYLKDHPGDNVIVEKVCY